MKNEKDIKELLNLAGDQIDKTLQDCEYVAIILATSAELDSIKSKAITSINTVLDGFGLASTLVSTAADTNLSITKRMVFHMAKAGAKAKDKDEKQS